MKSPHRDVVDQVPVKVLRIVTRLNVGGPSIQISNLMRHLPPQKFNQLLLHGVCSPGEETYLAGEKEDFRCVGITSLRRDLFLPRDILAFFRIGFEIRKFKPDIIHTHTSKAGLLGRLAGFLFWPRAKRIHTFHGHVLHGYFGKYINFAIKNSEKLLAIISHALIAVGISVKQELIEQTIGKEGQFVVIYPGIRIGSLPDAIEAKLGLGLEYQKIQVAFIGRMVPIKRPDIFLDVAHLAVERDLNISFFMAGDGELGTYCKERIADENLPVRYLGWLHNIEQVLAAADIVLLTSDNEGTPTVLIQSQMANKVVISTDVGATSEIIIDGVTGLLSQNSPNNFVENLEKLLDSKSLMSQLQLQGRNRATELFSINQFLTSHENLYLSLISEKDCENT